MTTPPDFLQLAGKPFLVFGVANRKSVAYHVGRTLEACGAQVWYVVRSAEQRDGVSRLLGRAEIFTCDVEREEEIAAVRTQVGERCSQLHGIVHSIAFADYEGEAKPFHQTTKAQFLRAIDISCYSLMAIANAFQDLLDPDASVVTISISTTRMASESYGFMGPVKAALDSSLAFLAKSFSRFSRVRFNAVAASLLKTSASAGIPGYVDAYLYAEQVIPRRKALETQEVANVAVFLLSPRSSGINAQSVVADAGMSINYFDNDLIRRAMRAGE
ncbi:MAG: SDR family oxidoreductase [Planctomycetaceae bacterium]|nr:SDR family oxidoreductase [Planctomycetaceae bacterium]